MTDLHAALVAAVTARRELAQAATPGPWEVGPTFGALDNRVYVRAEGGLIDSVGTCVIAGQVPNVPEFRENAKFIAANDPAQILRDTEAHLKILKLHQRYVNAVERGRKTGLHHDDPEGAAQDRACLMVLDEAFRALAGIYPEVTEQ